MAPIKFEEHIREKLEEREISPSTASWDKLSSRLDDSNKSSGKRLWISAVAAVVVMLIASTIFIDQQDQIATPVVNTSVEEGTDLKDNRNAIEEPVQVASEENHKKLKKIKGSSEAINSRSGLNENKIAQKTTLEEVEKTEETISPTLKREIIEPVAIKATVIAENSSDQLSEKVEKVLKRIKNEEERSGDLSSAEVDDLLAAAAREISREGNLYSEGVISADALLADVEYEVDQSFRKEVFDFLKEEFLKAKTAVATRND